MTSHRLRVHGRVQGVGFRAWLVRTAATHGVSGWVRNRGDGTVEALVQGPGDAVQEVLRLCRRGPPSASVTLLEESFADEEEADGFAQRPTAP